MKFSRLIFLLTAGVALGACSRAPEQPHSPPQVTATLSHHVFVWQRHWTGPVRTAVSAHGANFTSLGVFGGQIETGADALLKVVEPALDWNALAAAGRPVAPVFRIEHLSEIPEQRQITIDHLRRLTQNFDLDATHAKVTVPQVIIDYDCPQKKLADYGSWLAKAREALKPKALQITALPSWLGESELPGLLDQCDGWILQLHSFDLTRIARRPAICDPVQAAGWVAQAAALCRPFAVALSTYRATAGLDPNGRRVGLALEGPAPAWPPGTRQLDLESDPAGLAALVARWQVSRPVELQAIWWYRLPVESDVRNWRWLTLEAVMAGRIPTARWEVVATGRNPVDLTLFQTGEADGPPPSRISIDWPGHAPAAADALRGWSVDFRGLDGTVLGSPAEFTPSLDVLTRPLAPGTRTALGWLRYHEDPPSPHVLQIKVDQ